MAYNWEAISNNIINISQVLSDFLDSQHPKDVEWVYMDDNGNVHTLTVPNIAKAKQQLNDTCITPGELNSKLTDYYSKVEVNNIKNAIYDAIHNNLDKINANYNSLEELKKAKVMTKAEFDALAKLRKSQYKYNGQYDQNGLFINFFEASNGGYNYLFHTDMYRQWGEVPAKGVPAPNQLLFPLDENVFHCRRYSPKFNVNGYSFTYYGTGTGMQRPSAPNSNNYGLDLPDGSDVKAIISDDTTIPVDLEQGDFIIVKDLDREFINGTFDDGIDGWVQDSGGTLDIEWDSDNKRLQITRNSNDDNKDAKYYLNVLNKVDYTVTVGDFDTSKYQVIVTESGPYLVYLKPNSTVTVRFTTNTQRIVIRALDGVTGTYYFDNISIKQTREQPVAATKNIPAGSDIYDSDIKKYLESMDSISRQDLGFITTYIERIADRDIVYPYGNIQYRGTDIDGLNKIKDGDFEDADTYSLYGPWQKPGDLIGRGYKWSELTNDEKAVLAGNPENNIFIYGDEYYQFRYKTVIIKGNGNDFEKINRGKKGIGSLLFGKINYIHHGSCTDVRIKDLGNNSLSRDFQKAAGAWVINSSNELRWVNHCGYTAFGENIQIYLRRTTDLNIGNLVLIPYQDNAEGNSIPLFLTQRRNKGIYHPVYNPEGTALIAYDDGNGLLAKEWWDVPSDYITSLSDCFDPDKIATVNPSSNSVGKLSAPQDGYYRTGTVRSRISGNTDDRYSDGITKHDIEDLRKDCSIKTPNEILDIYLENVFNIGKYDVKGTEKRFKTYWQQFWLSSDASVCKKDGGIFVYEETGTSRRYLRSSFGVYAYPAIIYGAGEYFRNKINLNNIYRTYILMFTDNEGNIISEPKMIEETSFGGQLHTSRPSGCGGFKLLSVRNDDYYFTDYGFKTTVDIIGDVRKLKDRVQYTVTSTNETIPLSANEYILCNDATNNNGSAGHLYRWLGGALSGIDTNSDDSNKSANVDGGKIDFSDAGFWKDLGSDLEIGGYPEYLLKNPVYAMPLISTPDGESQLPVDVMKNADKTAAIFKFARKFRERLRLVVIKPDGTKVKIPKGKIDNYYSLNDLLTLASGNNGNNPEYKNQYFISTSQNAVGLSTDLYDEDTDTLIAEYITYPFYNEYGVRNRKLSDIYFIYSYGSDEDAGVGLNFDLISKIPNIAYSPVSNYIAKYCSSNSSVTDIMYHDTDNKLYHKPNLEYFAFEQDAANYRKGVKYAAYLTKDHDRVYLQFSFKELKYDAEAGNIGDNNYIELYNGVTSTSDINGNRVLVGQKRMLLPFFNVDI